MVHLLVITSSVNFEDVNGKGSIILDWADYDFLDKYFVIYRKEENSNEWKKLLV